MTLQKKSKRFPESNKEVEKIYKNEKDLLLEKKIIQEIGESQISGRNKD